MSETIINDEFLLEFFRMCLKPDRAFVELAINHLKYNYLPEEPYKKILKEITNRYKIDNKLSTFGSLKLEFRKDRSVLETLEEIKETELPADPDILVDGLERYIKEARFHEIFEEVSEVYNGGEKHKAISKFVDAAEGLSKIDLKGENYDTVIGGFKKRNIERIVDNSTHSSKIPFGIDKLDRITKGGAEPGELVMWLGDSKAGKSFALTHVGMTGARRGFPTAHFQLEDTKKKCLARYDSCWSGTTYHDVKAGQISDDKYKVFEKIAKNFGKTDIHVYATEKFLAMTVGELRTRLVKMIAKYGIKLVVIDYLELLMPDSSHYGPGDERFRQQKVARMLKDLAVELQVVIHTATQASSIPSELLNDPDFVITREHLSEDKGKVRPVDMLISINKTREERKQKVCRLFTEAMREYDSNDVIYIKQNLATSRFYDRAGTLNEFFEEEEE